ncbi:hypothetical protein GH733_009322 [Mirounga leonina]|nr:hypothetical protein GH733_009322 [Mirounga leonina]
MDQPVIAITSNSLREDLGPGSLVATSSVQTPSPSSHYPLPSPAPAPLAELPLSLTLGLGAPWFALRTSPCPPTYPAKPTRKTSSVEREGWWRIALTNTPIPGTYHLKTFIEESSLNPVIPTYNFKNEGRKKPPLVQRNDPVLNDLPLYAPPDFLDLLKKQMATYSFRDKPRSSPSKLVYKDQFSDIEGSGTELSVCTDIILPYFMTPRYCKISECLVNSD